MQRDDFLTAAEQYLKSGSRSDAKKLLMELAEAKAATCMFSEVRSIYFRLAQQSTESAEFILCVRFAGVDKFVCRLDHFRKLSELYYCYGIVYESVFSPFAVVEVGVLFNVSHFLSTQLDKANLPKARNLILYVGHCLFSL